MGGTEIFDFDGGNVLDCFTYACNDRERHPEGDNPQDLQTQNHVITRNNVEQEGQKSIQRDVVIPNELGNGETCLGLRHWKLLHNL